MNYSNLPPGVRECNIPGNRPCDAEWETAIDAASDAVAEFPGLSAEERDYLYQRFADMGVGELLRWMHPSQEMIDDEIEALR